MKNINYILFGILGFIALTLNSCDSILDKQPDYSLTEENSITDFSKAEAAVRGIYASFQNDSWSGALYMSLASKSGFVNWSELDYNMEYSQQNMPGSPTSIWGNFYKSLNAANFAINGISDLSAVAVPSEEERKALIGEARCLRAWVNINILWNYGHWWAPDDDEYGLLYRDEVVNLSNVEQKRLSVGESYQKIYEDLDYAIQHLNSFHSPRFVSKEFAKALKAKTLLYRAGYLNDKPEMEIALKLVNEVLDQMPSGLSLESDMNQMYQQAWDSSENLFVKYLEDNGSRYSSGGHSYSYALVYEGDRLPLATGATLTAGLNYGLDWFKNDPRWDIATGEVRAPETWDDTYRWTWKKLTRLGRYGGQQATPPDEMYATYYFRAAELFIIKSELLARLGKSPVEAIAPINQLRSMRSVPTLEALNPTSDSELMDMIFKEYFLELFLENGSEFFASVRFHNNGKPWVETIKEGKSLNENRMCWPIPNEEMINNTLMTQNPDLQ